MTDLSTRVSPDPKENPLTSPHLEMLLEESRISPEIIAERGYKSITADQALELGFSEN